MANWENCEAVERDLEKVSGAWVFKGTRIPVLTLFENLKEGASIEQFFEWFPGVDRQQVETVKNGMHLNGGVNNEKISPCHQTLF